MKRRYILIIWSILLTLLPLLNGCIREEEFDNTPQGNFEALWKIIDEQYCFLDYKQIDWDAIHDKYQPLITPGMSYDGLFEILGNMLAELKDGHVNLYSSSNMARYWDWYLDYPRNFNESIIEKYLGRDYRIAGGAKYTILEDNIGYIYYGDFSSGIGNGNLDEILLYLSACNGLIIDVRNNGGGNLTNATRMAQRFTNEKVLTGYIQHKTGKGHSDFSDPTPIYVEPSNSIRWQKKVIVLTNRHSYSATNDFVNSMRCFPNVTLVGDKTGGGSGLPFSSELPNGWGVRFSASPHLDAQKQHIEFGIDPAVPDRQRQPEIAGPVAVFADHGAGRKAAEPKGAEAERDINLFDRMPGRTVPDPAAVLFRRDNLLIPVADLAVADRHPDFPAEERRVGPD